MPVCAGGLFNRIHHPIYSGDAVPYTAFAVYPATAVSLGIGRQLLWLLAVALWALHRQAVREDAEMSDTFGQQHAAWRARTGRFWLVG